MKTSFIPAAIFVSLTLSACSDSHKTEFIQACEEGLSKQFLADTDPRFSSIFKERAKSVCKCAYSEMRRNFSAKGIDELIKKRPHHFHLYYSTAINNCDRFP